MRKLPVTITEEEFLKIIKAVKDDRKLILAFMLGFYQCMRISEVLKLKSEDVDKERGFIHIIAGKGNKDRDVSIMRPIQAGLKYLPIDIPKRTLQRAISTLAKEVLDKDITFHTLRHSGASFYLNKKNIDIRHLQTLLGHSNISTTQIYTHVTPENLKEVFDKVWKDNA